MMKRVLLVVVVAAAALGVGLAAQSAKPTSQAAAPAKTTIAKPAAAQRPVPAPPLGGPKDWPSTGSDPGGMKYSSLKQITPENVSRLAVAWTYDTGVPANGYQVHADRHQ